VTATPLVRAVDLHKEFRRGGERIDVLRAVSRGQETHFECARGEVMAAIQQPVEHWAERAPLPRGECREAADRLAGRGQVEPEQ
jgi:hypothetical protein